MRFGGTVLPRLCLLVAVFATLTLLGCWDNKRTMEQVLAGGYETAAQVVGAQYQRKLPFALDGYKPRFVEQDISVDLTWKGRDGKNREFRKVPVSESFARNIVAGDQVKLVAHVYECRTDGPFRFADGEITEAHWVSPAEFPNWLGAKQFLPDSLALVLPRLRGFRHLSA